MTAAHETIHKLIERAFLDGIAYATNVEVTDPALAWNTFRARHGMKRAVAGAIRLAIREERQRGHRALDAERDAHAAALAEASLATRRGLP